MKVLFLSASTGGGHTKAAEAIIERMYMKNQDFEGKIVDALKYINPFVDRLITGTYLAAIRNTPGIYGQFYGWAEKKENITNITKNFNRLVSNKLTRLINDYKPEVIVCTHTFPVQMLSVLKKRGKISIPVIAVVTDFVSHLFWKLDGVDAFVVAHAYIKSDMVKMGIEESRIFVYGIPVSADFLLNKDRETILGKLGLKNKTTILLMGGSLGLGDVRKTLKSLLKSKRDLQIIAVAGHNKKLEIQLMAMASRFKKDVIIYGFTDRISDLMDVSDFIITKPGGVTISEALVKGIPIILMSPIPGQEERNAAFLTNTGAAARIYRNDDMEGMLCQILDNPLRIRHMKEMAQYLAKPEAGDSIITLIEKMSDQGNILLAKTGFPSLPVSFKPSSLT